MKKNVFKGLLTMCAFAAAFTSCSKENNEIPNPGENDTKSVFMKMDLPAVTRAVEQPVTGTATVNNLHVYFHDNTNILKYVNVTSSTSITIANLTAGAKIADVPASATHVTIYGNIPSGTSLPTGGTLASVKAVEIGITSQSTITDVVLGGADKALSTYSGGVAPSWAAGISDGDKYAEVEIAPAVARIEIAGLKAGGNVTAFTLEGIFVNNFFEKFKLEGSTVGAKTQYGADATKYAANAPATLYTTANSGKLFDQPNAVAAGSPLAAAPTGGAAPRWAYQVVPFNDADVNQQLQLIFRLKDLAATGVTFPPAAPQFLTVRGFKDAGTGVPVQIEAGKIYTISQNDFEFDESDLTTVPNTTAVGVWLKVTVKAWTVVPVKPNL
ncbi:hypothetical protein ACMYZ8_12320 [Bacteroides sp. KG156]|uniref:hypothetical protein n=1 Tax=unclassified Bacteroides TaxID=2646097 RepID=UPI003D96DA89